MSDRITGSFPGGPTRSDTSPQRDGPLRTQSVRERAEDRAARSIENRRSARSRRVLLGFVLAVVVAGAVGWGLGRQDQPTQTSLQQEAVQQRAADLDISREVNRALLEIWRMEEVEANRNR